MGLVERITWRRWDIQVSMWRIRIHRQRVKSDRWVECGVDNPSSLLKSFQKRRFPWTVLIYPSASAVKRKYKKCISVTNTAKFMQFRNVIAVFWASYKIHKYTLTGKRRYCECYSKWCILLPLKQTLWFSLCNGTETKKHGGLKHM
jgi:hypothetical protein